LATLHRAPGSAGQVRVAAAADTTVTGTVTYQDRNSTTRPVRSGKVDLVNTAGDVYATARTNAAGSFTLTALGGVTGSFRVIASSDNPYGAINRADPGPPYTVYSVTRNLQPGTTWSGVGFALTRDSLDGRAFALLDAMYTVGGFYQQIRQSSWPSRLTVRYPSGSDLSYTNGFLIQIAGGDTTCGSTWCYEDAFNWDVLAHEVGHVVAAYAGMTSSPGGAHNICDAAWTGGRSKADAVALAWSEGWASFYGLASLASGIPAGIPEAGGTAYNRTAGPPHNVGGSFSADLESVGGGCNPRGDDSELAVARALWDLWDPSIDEPVSWSLSDMLGRLDTANADTFAKAWPALASGRSTSDLDNAGGILEQWGFAPTGLLPPSGRVGNSPIHFAWAAGGMPNHPNNAFTITIRNAATNAVLVSPSTGANTDYLPSTSTWATIAAAGTVLVDVAGRQTGSPASGPYVSKRTRLVIGGVPRVMVVGDSISHGLEGDYTWRYRLKQHFGTAVNVDFVGPRLGTTRLPATLPAGFPDVPATVSFSGAYRDGLMFDSDHFSQWGWQAHQAMNDIQTGVTQYQPDYLLVELGFNDLGWGVSDADGLVADIKTFIARARAAKPDVRVLVANVVHRTPLPNLPGLDALITSYNTKLGPALQSVNTTASPVRLVDISTGYDPAVDAYDGLHPGGIGEYKIARAFGNVLSSQFALGPAFGTIPTSVAPLTLGTTTGLDAVPTDAGITVSWNHTFGAGGYWFEMRDATNGEGFQRLPLQIPADSWKVNWLTRGHSYEFRVVPTRGNQTGGISNTDSAVANPKTAEPPRNIVVTPGSGYIDLSWDPPIGLYSDTVSGYTVHYNDQSVAGSVMTTVRTGTRSIRLSGLVNGHTYALAVGSVNAAGDGNPGGAPAAIPGAGRPAAPTLVSARWTTPTDAVLTWNAVPGAASYWILFRDDTTTNPFARIAFPIAGTQTTTTVGWLFSGAIHYEFCVIAANGSLESPPSNCLFATSGP
jgi:lysophospholipase L1-like esterase